MKPKCEESLSNFGVNRKLRHYNEVGAYKKEVSDLANQKKVMAFIQSKLV